MVFQAQQEAADGAIQFHFDGFDETAYFSAYDRDNVKQYIDNSCFCRAGQTLNEAQFAGCQCNGPPSWVTGLPVLESAANSPFCWEAGSEFQQICEQHNGTVNVPTCGLSHACARCATPQPSTQTISVLA